MRGNLCRLGLVCMHDLGDGNVVSKKVFRHDALLTVRLACLRGHEDTWKSPAHSDGSLLQAVITLV